jgi:hypothetical protein
MNKPHNNNNNNNNNNNKNLLRLGTNQVRRGNRTGEKWMGAVGCASTQINFSVCLTVCLECEVTQKAALSGCVWVDSDGEIGWQSPQPWACHGVDGTASLRWCQRRQNRGRRRLFLQHANWRIDRWWWPPSSYCRHGPPLPAPAFDFKHTTINKHTRQQVRG